MLLFSKLIVNIRNYSKVVMALFLCICNINNLLYDYLLLISRMTELPNSSFFFCDKEYCVIQRSQKACN